MQHLSENRRFLGFMFPQVVQRHSQGMWKVNGDVVAYSVSNHISAKIIEIS